MLGLQPGLVHHGDAASPEQQVIEAPFFSVDSFLLQGEAERLRGEIDAHFAKPEKHDARHQVWNYWHVPQLYTYLRTSPEKVIAAPLVMRFYEALSVFAREVLGLGHVTWPNLSLYVDGCEQHLHNDSANGRLGYVYSLTRDARKTIGGETIVLHEGDLFRSNLARAAAGWGLYDLIEPSFNRLALFDDRIPHGVRRVDGSMDPMEGRFVLHGHISESAAFADGPISADDIGSRVNAALSGLEAELQAGPAAPHGPLTLRLAIAASGRVERIQPMLNRVARSDGLPACDAVEQAIAIIRGLSWPAAPVATDAVVPILFGGALPWMRAAASP
jgi:Rps23 Pro-64 3,4-dihydroxylase Tpa1-like proline 4-hydroxylase